MAPVQLMAPPQRRTSQRRINVREQRKQSVEDAAAITEEGTYLSLSQVEAGDLVVATRKRAMPEAPDDEADHLPSPARTATARHRGHCGRLHINSEAPRDPAADPRGGDGNSSVRSLEASSALCTSEVSLLAVGLAGRLSGLAPGGGNTAVQTPPSAAGAFEALSKLVKCPAPRRAPNVARLEGRLAAEAAAAAAEAHRFVTVNSSDGSSQSVGDSRSSHSSQGDEA
ncbi:hypothetical protein EMIHUDRAFT_104833 [Emiliania huxleyi CCMP1516]|uniref:Uncharacterized protein n=2 Tax=Emiliania huxleyi TaxID=2903 RepID=A0A0D3IJJ8_EMIH1|nr:hypothetical protein EMIHUDRAFT_104833 [Emiliania huxleyi CCMP1516]EOD11433.1 hypothetical protein EMIHUDRAFT_104833 [Emiliania huxleyi CCMP1516]|eukprot:XP_005763862.1 hypothetical protein EMIHUDRAFT_104833 [Emiliania huxleyi CCMP1516]